MTEIIEHGITMRDLAEDDYLWLFKVETHPKNIFRYRLCGSIPPFERYRQMVDDVLLQFVVVRELTGERIGHVYAYRHEPENGTAYISWIKDPDINSGIIMAHALRMMIVHLFDQYSMRKLYGEMCDYGDGVAIGFRALTRLARLEATLKGHSYFGGEFRDWYTVALYREDWAPFLGGYDSNG
ncbi:MAG: GNAT family N-acetyltransferase [Acidimicrobiales bacterium]